MKNPLVRIIMALVALAVVYVGNQLKPADDQATARDNITRQPDIRQSDIRKDNTPSYRKNKSSNNQDIATGKFDYYDLVLSWSPSYCETGGLQKRDPQCTSSRPYAFVLHGVWPQFNKGWPSNCSTGKNPWISNEVIQSMMDIMPSKGLIIHEYKKHGTCTGLQPEGYYNLSRDLYNAIKIPPRYKQADKPLMLSPKEIEDDFLIANRDLKPDMISIVCGQRRLREVRICFDRNKNLTSCGQNENQNKLCRLPKVYLPPVRK